MTALLARARRELSPQHLLLTAVVATVPIALVVLLLVHGWDLAVLAVPAGLILGTQSYLVIISPMVQCQHRAQPTVRGRVIAVRRTSRAAAQVAGLGLVAVLAKWIPPLALMVAGSVLATLPATYWAWRAVRSSMPSASALTASGAAGVGAE